jgi:hypothetical protein
VKWRLRAWDDRPMEEGCRNQGHGGRISGRSVCACIRERFRGGVMTTWSDCQRSMGARKRAKKSFTGKDDLKGRVKARQVTA